MILLANMLLGLAYILRSIIWLLQILIIARVVISWVNADPYNPIVRFISSSTDPLIEPIRRRMPNMGGLDLSPLVFLLLIMFIQFAVVGSMQDYAVQMKMQSSMPVRAF